MTDAEKKTESAAQTRRRRCVRIAGRAACFALVLTLVGIAAAPRASAAFTDTLGNLLHGDSQPLQIVLELTLIALIPTLLIMLTGFTRIVIVLSMVRNAIGLQNMPPNMVIIGMALFLTYFVMSPAIEQINDTALQPYINNEIEYDEFAETAMEPLRDFMLKQTYVSDLDFFIDLSGTGELENVERDVPNSVLIPAFVTSELKHALAIGFFIYIPFIVIDMVVASTLMAMGMMMLPPATISLPFKIMLFVLVDGWQLTIGTLISGFGG